MADRREEEVKLLPIAGALAMLGGSALPGQDLPQWVLELSRIKRQAKAELIRLPDFACVETINRFEQASETRAWRPMDTIRLEVAFVEGKELFAPVGAAGGFHDMPLSEMANDGAVGTGAFSAVARNLFVNDNGRTTGRGEENIMHRPALRYDFVISEMFSGYTIHSRGGQASVALEGSFWADAETLELLRVEERVVDIPASLGIRDSSETVTYAKTRIGASDVLLPRSAELVVTSNKGLRHRNEIEFTGCREYVAESMIRFDATEPAPATQPGKKK